MRLGHTRAISSTCTVIFCYKKSLTSAVTRNPIYSDLNIIRDTCPVLTVQTNHYYLTRSHDSHCVSKNGNKILYFFFTLCWFSAVDLPKCCSFLWFCYWSPAAEQKIKVSFLGSLMGFGHIQEMTRMFSGVYWAMLENSVGKSICICSFELTFWNFQNEGIHYYRTFRVECRVRFTQVFKWGNRLLQNVQSDLLGYFGLGGSVIIECSDQKVLQDVLRGFRIRESIIIQCSTQGDSKMVESVIIDIIVQSYLLRYSRMKEIYNYRMFSMMCALE